MEISKEVLEKLKPYLKKRKGYAQTIQNRLEKRDVHYSLQSIYATVAGRMQNTDILIELALFAEEEKQKEQQLRQALQLAVSR